MEECPKMVIVQMKVQAHQAILAKGVTPPVNEINDEKCVCRDTCSVSSESEHIQQSCPNMICVVL